jgi:anti-anti-sigma regulatory factor
VAPVADRQLGSVQVERLGASLWLLTMVGEHDLSNVDKLGEALTQIEATGTTVIVDLSEARFIDSTVIARIIASDARGENCLLVVPASGAVRRVLELVDIRIPMFETRIEASRALPDRDQP